MEKQQIRTKLLRERRALSPSAVKAASQQIYERTIQLTQIQKASVVLVYADFDNEVSTSALTGWLLYNHKTVALPVIEDSTMTAAVYRGTALEPNAFGVGQPPFNKETAVDPGRIDVIVCPGIAFTKDRDRLGFGKGYYDRFFEEAPRACRIGLAYGFQVIDCLQPDEHDVQMNVVVTPEYVLN